MVYLKKILVTTDLSEYSLAALEYASSFALLYASRIYLLHVSEHGAHRGEEQSLAALREFMEAKVESDWRLTPVVRSGHASEEIRKFAQEEGVDLIVMATHGRTGLRHTFMGSVAERVVRHCAIPVLTVKPRPLRESILRNEDIESELHLR